MPNTFHRLKHGLLLFLLTAASTTFSQNILQINYDPADIRQPSKEPAKLVDALTKNKDTDKEKFDAIFAWVATNIDYDYRAYYSSGGAGKPDIKRILKRKKGICLEYAALMDTLCELAGIRSFSVYGYAKDEIFDVQDSLYLDNHAWNAVKLDGLWYVYDVTWASGKVEYYYIKRSRFVIKLVKKFKPRYKSKTIKGWDLKDICAQTGTFKKEEQTITWKTYRFNWLRNFLLRRTLHIRSRQSPYIDSTWYLADPALFAVTHIPDDSNWSLLPNKTIRDFETDSAFYHLNDSIYKAQIPHGYSCYECDLISGSEEWKFYLDLQKKSLDFNPRNHFTPSMCEAFISNHVYDLSTFTEDSLKKVTLIDSSLSWLAQTQKSLSAAGADVMTDTKLQQDKNRRKNTMLREDNNIHNKFITGIVNKTTQRIKNSDKHINKRRRLAQKYQDRSKKIVKYKTDIEIKKNSRLDTAAVNLLKRTVFKKEKAYDSIQAVINEHRLTFDKLSPLLVDKALDKVNKYDMLLSPYFEKYYQRVMFLDDYKKPVVEAKKKIYRTERNYSDELDSTLYAFADSIISINDRIAELVETRTLLSKDIYALKSKQVKSGQVPLDELLLYKRQLYDDNLDDFCWVRSGHTRMILSNSCFNLLKYYQEALKIALKRELKAENDRSRYVSKELQRRSNKYRNIVNTNKRVVKTFEKRVKDDKRDFLKKLKEAAKISKGKQT